MYALSTHSRTCWSVIVLVLRCVRSGVHCVWYTTRDVDHALTSQRRDPRNEARVVSVRIMFSVFVCRGDRMRNRTAWERQLRHILACEQ